MPGIADEVWKPVVLPVTAGGHHRDRDLLLRAIDNGRMVPASRCSTVGRPTSVEWVGGAQAVWTSDVPRDLTVDRVYFIQAKYDSTCVLNTAPGTMIDELLADDGSPGRPSWFEEVAPEQLQAYYRSVRGQHDLAELPDRRARPQPRRSGRAQVRHAVDRRRPRPRATAYVELCREVSEQTARRWRRRLAAATQRQRCEMLFRMLRIAGGPYWLLGTKGSHAVRLAVDDTRAWRQRFELRRFTVSRCPRRSAAGRTGEPRSIDRDGRASGGSSTATASCDGPTASCRAIPSARCRSPPPLGDLPGYRRPPEPSPGANAADATRAA